MSVLRERLAAELAGKVERHGVVVWDDPEGAYTAVIDEIAPPAVTVESFDGSWYDLRHRLEQLLCGQDLPTLVVYVPTKPIDPDPLEEVRAIGTRFCITLPTLVKQACTGTLTEQRIAQIGEQCATIGEAETAIDGGDTAVDARLINTVGKTSTVDVVAALVAGTHETQIVDNGLEEVARSTLAGAIGGDYTGLRGSELRRAAFRQIVLAQIDHVVALPDDLVATYTPATAAQSKTAHAVIDRLQTRTEVHERYIELADAADQQLHLSGLLTWSEGLAGLDTTHAIEEINLTHAYHLLDNDDPQAARELATSRLSSSWWLSPHAPEGDTCAVKYRFVTALADLAIAIAQPVPAIESVAVLRDWYTTHGWKVDAAYRGCELTRVTAGVVIEELDGLFHDARQRYEAWLDQVLHAAADAMAAAEIPNTELQRAIHDRYVKPGGERTAYVLVDALRYELGKDLVERLGTVHADVTIDAAIATPPTITPVGMAALLPKADTDFGIELDADDRLQVRVAKSLVKTVKDRVNQLEHAHGPVVDLLLDDVAQFSNKELKKNLGESGLVLVRSTEIDSAGEVDKLAASWGSFDVTLDVLRTAIAKLLHAGIHRVVVTADHGFLATRQLGDERRIDKPATGNGELHRRAWIGRGGTSSQSTLKVPLNAFGITGDLDIITPRGLGVFTSGGGLQFFHGGLSPQELIVPVIVVTRTEASPEPKYQIALSVAGGRITTGVIAVTIAMTGDLFTSESPILVRLIQNENHVATVVGGDGYHRSTGAIDAKANSTQVVTMQITENLRPGTTATLEVLDAATGVRLAAADIDVAADIQVNDDLD